MNASNGNIQQQINLQVAPDGNVIVTCSLGMSAQTIIIPGTLMDEFLKRYLIEKKNQKDFMESLRRSKH